jgi:hypothetical protein
MNGFASLLRNRAAMTPRRWSFHGRGPRVDVRGEMWADTEDFVGLFSSNPDGTASYFLETVLAKAEVTIRIAGRSPQTLGSQRATLELATRQPHHGVRMHV